MISPGRSFVWFSGLGVLTASASSPSTFSATHFSQPMVSNASFVLRSRVRQRLQENAEVVGTDEAFFEDDRNDQRSAISSPRKRASSTAMPTPKSTLGSHAFQIWKNAIDRDPSLQKIIPAMPNVVYSTKPHTPGSDQPEGVLVYMRTAEGNDALAWVDKQGNPITESQFAILKAAECEPDTLALPRHENHHDLVRQGVERIASEEKSIGGQLGSTLRGAIPHLRTAQALCRRGQGNAVRHTRTAPCHRRHLQLSASPAAVDILNRQLRSGISDANLVQRVIELREEGRLCIIHDEEEPQEPSIICSLGLRENERTV